VLYNVCLLLIEGVNLAQFGAFDDDTDVVGTTGVGAFVLNRVSIVKYLVFVGFVTPVITICPEY
jgi:hypothetical protein